VKKIFLKNMIAICLITTVVSSINTVEAHAVWNRNSKNKWVWIENQLKAVGWKNIQGKWYYFYSNGEMATGWIKESGKWYYLSNSGAMITGWFKDSNGKWYYLSSSGAMVTGWFKDYSGKWYFLNNNGEMVTGWLNNNGSKYYLGLDGAMVTGKITIEGKLCQFSNDGALMKCESVGSSSSFEKEENRIGYIVTDRDPLNIRMMPSKNSDVIGSIPKGSKILVLGKEENGFYKISWNNINGYASSRWISFEKPSGNKDNLSEIFGSIRTTAPSTSDKYYYSDSNLFYKAKLAPPFISATGKRIVGNCTWYAWGRIWELTGRMPIDADFTGNAYEWWGANKRTGKYRYGTTPKVGAIPVWKSSLPNSGGCGHVAVVEKIENGKVYISESSWHGSLFNYREIYNTEHLYGYIYIDQYNY